MMERLSQQSSSLEPSVHGVRCQSAPDQPVASKDLRAADAVLMILREAGVTTIFGLPGGSIAPVYDALLDHPEFTMVPCRQEGGAVFAAAAYAQMTGRLGVAFVTSGPGVLSTMNALASAYADSLPVLVIAGEAARSSAGRGGVQEGSAHSLHVVGMAKHITKVSAEAHAGISLPGLLRHMISTCATGKRGPALLSLPIDVQGSIIPESRAITMSTTYDVIAEPLLVEVAEVLNAAKKPLILAGSGTRGGDAPGALVDLAERMQAPVATTPKGKGVFPENHALSLGVFGMGGHAATGEYLALGIDTLVVVGSSLNEVATDGWDDALSPELVLVHIDIEAAQIGKAYATNIAVAAPAAEFLRQIIPLLDVKPEGRGHVFESVEDPETLTAGADGLITAPRALWEMQQILPADSIYTVDSGSNFFFAAHYLRVAQPDAFVSFLGMGSMGCAIPAAIGARLAAPGRPVVAICGDGGFIMSACELATAAALEVPILVCVLNNGCYGMAELGHQAVYGRGPSFDMTPMIVEQLASAFGADTALVSRPGEFLELAESCNNLKRPLVVEVRFASHVGLPRNRRFDSVQEQQTAPQEDFIVTEPLLDTGVRHDN